MPQEIRLTLITDDRYRLHDTGGRDHPESPERMRRIADALAAAFPDSSLERVSPRSASREEVRVFHPDAWLFRFEEEVLFGRTFIDHQDNQVGEETFSVALLAAGAGLTAIDLVETDPDRVVFCLVRPPGHHAEPVRPYGFCFFNNCVIAARYWQQHHGRQRVCVFDFDAHHGNGIQTAFEEDPDVLYISIHEHPSFSYPGTGWAEERGNGPGRGTLLNLPLPPGAGDERILSLLDGPVAALLEAFVPEALVVAAGFDGHYRDDMSGLAYSSSCFREIGRRLGQWSRALCSGRMVSILEGGYHLDSLAESVVAYLTGLQPEQSDTREKTPCSSPPA